MAAGVLAAAGALVAGIALALSTGPYFDVDTYKYLAAADAVVRGHPLPPLYRTLAATGGALHAVPGYGYFLAACWKLAGEVSLTIPLLLQCLIATGGAVAAGYLLVPNFGPWAVPVVTLAVAAAPPRLWSNLLVMPDALTAPLWFLLAAGIRAGTRRKAGTWMATALGLGAGCMAGAMILMRTSSQALLPALVAVALAERPRPRRLCVWGCGCALGLAAVLAPWALSNKEHHGYLVVSASTGRNLLLNALWAGTIERSKELAKLGVVRRPDFSSAYLIVDRRFAREVRRTRSIPAADRALQRYVIDAYRKAGWRRVAADRLRIAEGLFDPRSKAGSWLGGLDRLRAAGWANPRLSSRLLEQLGRRFGHRFSSEVTSAVRRAERRGARIPRWFDAWSRAATLENLPLLGSFLVALTWLGVRRRIDAVTASAVLLPLACLWATVAVFGTPLYRFQIQLQPFMVSLLAAAGLDFARFLAARRR